MFNNFRNKTWGEDLRKVLQLSILKGWGGCGQGVRDLPCPHNTLQVLTGLKSNGIPALLLLFTLLSLLLEKLGLSQSGPCILSPGSYMGCVYPEA